jgi:hypothetical protein
MSARVYAAQLEVDQLPTLIDKVRPHTSFAILERLDNVGFYGSSDKTIVSEWQKGRIFGENIELRWDLDSPYCQAILALSDEIQLPEGFSEVLPLDGYRKEDTCYYLWGEDDIAIGGRLDYSKALPHNKGRVKLTVFEYRDKKGCLVFYRYAGLTPEGKDD